MKTLLLDIDYTLIDGDVPRPYLKEFMEHVTANYNVRFYTAGNRQKVVQALKIMVHKIGFDDYKVIHGLQRKALTSQNCPTIEHKKESGTYITIKCFKKASEVLGVPVEDMIMLDDNPSFDHPNASQIIQAEGFRDYNTEDDYLKRLIDQKIL